MNTLLQSTRLALVLVSLLAVNVHASTTLPDPYPQAGAGWGPSLGEGRMASGWAEPLPPGENLALHAELRLRQGAWRDLPGRGSTDQGQLRAVLGADWRPLPS